jgi:hypothetical protein
MKRLLMLSPLVFVLALLWAAATPMIPAQADTSESGARPALAAEPAIAYAPLAQKKLLQRSGKLSLLRVHNVGTGYGPPGDSIDVEVVIAFRGQEGAYGFQLRNNSNLAAHQGMLDLLRDAFAHEDTVLIDYEILAGDRNGVIIRTALTK